MNKIWLNKELVTEQTLTTDGVLAYVALRTIYNMNNTTDYISVNRLAYSLIGEMDYPKSLTDSLARGLIELASGEWISIRKDLSTNKSYEYILDLSKLHIDTSKDKFVTIDDEEIYKLLIAKGDMAKKIRILKYFIALISTFDNSPAMKIVQGFGNLQGKIGHMTESFIAVQADCSVKSCQRYNDFLMENKLIYVYKSADFTCHENISGNNEVHQIGNCYSRYEDGAVCKEFASNYENIYGTETKIILSNKKKAKANKNRGLAQIYVQICGGNIDYSQEKIKEVYKYIVNKNKTLLEKAEEKKQNGYTGEYYLDQIRDVSIFEQFEFLNVNTQNGNVDEWGEQIDFSVEEMLDMPTVCEVQMNPTKKVSVTDSDLHSEGDNQKMDSQKNLQKSSNPSKDDLDFIDIDSLFDEDTDNRPVLSQEEAWELFA